MNVATSQIGKMMTRPRRTVLAGSEADLTDGQLLDCFASPRPPPPVLAFALRTPSAYNHSSDFLS
jgi:hypothetical protein